LKEVPAVEPYNTSATSHDVDSPASLKSDTEHSTSSEINFQPEIHTDARESQPAEVIQLNSFPATLKRLKQRIDPSLVKTREGSVDHTGTTQIIEYVEWHVVADILDRIAPTWQHHIRSVTQIGSFVAVTAAITIDGISREGVGTGTTANETGIKKAEHDALKRAAVKFGIARELYRREAAIIDREGSTMSPGEVEG
jgi:hypothetical protein